MRLPVALVLVVALLSFSSPAQETSSSTKTAKHSLARRVTALITAFENAQKRFTELYTKAKTATERRRILKKEYPDTTAYRQKLAALAAENPTSDAARTAAIWVIDQGRKPDGPMAAALEILTQHHAKSPAIESTCGNLRFQPTKEARSFLRAVLAQNPKREIRGQACFSLAQLLKTAAELSRTLHAADAKALKRFRKFYGEKTVSELVAAEPAKVEDRAAHEFERVLAEYADLSYYGKKSLGDGARGALFEMRHLSVGKVAPDIVGEDIDGTPFKLSDYRGRVVLLVFWGDW